MGFGEHEEFYPPALFIPHIKGRKTTMTRHFPTIVIILGTLGLASILTTGCDSNGLGVGPNADCRADLVITHVLDNTMLSGVKAGKPNTVINVFMLEATHRPIRMQATPMGLESFTGDQTRVRGSAGTAYFRNFRTVDIDDETITSFNQTLTGPAQIPEFGPATTFGPVYFEDTFVVQVGQKMTIAQVVDIAAIQDAPGELFGQVFRAIIGDRQEGYAFPEESVCFADDPKCLGYGKHGDYKGPAQDHVTIDRNYLVTSMIIVTPP